MARTNLATTRVKPDVTELLTLHVVRREQVSPSVVRVTLGGADADRFTFMGFDQWFRLFIPVSGGSLDRAPQKLSMVSYMRYLTVSKTVRPVLRAYSVRAYRPDGVDGPEIDVDVVVHGSAHDETAGPGATWAQTCAVGDPVAIIDEGIGFTPPAGTRSILLVADETGLPAVAGILASLAADTVGLALVEVPVAEDVQDLSGPDGVEVRWVVRDDATAVPGQAVLAAALEVDVPESVYAWAVGESRLPVALRRHWVAAGVPKDRIMFCGYWKAGHAR